MGLLVVGMGLTACNDDDDNASPTMETNYALNELDGSGVDGTVTFRKVGTDATLIIIQLSGTQEGNSHPAHIHSGNAATGGPIVVDFNPVDGATGRSETTVTTLEDGTEVTYEELIAYDGHVNVHESATALQVMVAQGDIGSNSTGIAGN